MQISICQFFKNAIGFLIIILPPCLRQTSSKTPLSRLFYGILIYALVMARQGGRRHLLINLFSVISVTTALLENRARLTFLFFLRINETFLLYRKKEEAEKSGCSGIARVI